MGNALRSILTQLVAYVLSRSRRAFVSGWGNGL